MKTVIVPIPAEIWGGLHGVICSIDSHLKSLGFEQKVILPEGTDNIKKKMSSLGVSTECVPLPRFKRSLRGNLTSILEYPQAIQHLSEIDFIRKADIFQGVGAHHLHSLLLSRKLKRPLVWQLHSSILSGASLSIAKILIRKSENGVLANGHSVAKYFLGAKFGAGNHELFYPPINTEQYHPNKRIRNKKRQELDIKEDEFLVTTIGNRSWQKNHQLFINAALEIRKASQKIKFLIVGAPVPSYENIYQKEVLSKIAKINKQTGNIIQITHAQSGVNEIIQATDMLLMTSHAEGIPLAIGESMSAGKPCLSTNVGSISDILGPCTIGGLTESFSPKEIAEKVLSIYRTPPQIREQHSQQIQLNAKSLFNPEMTAKIHAQVYKKALENFKCKK